MQHKHQNKLFVQTPPTTHSPHPRMGKVLNNFLRPPITHADGNDILMGILELVLYSGRWRDLRNLGDCLDGRLFAPCRCPSQRGTEYEGARPKRHRQPKRYRICTTDDTDLGCYQLFDVGSLLKLSNDNRIVL